MTVFHFLISFTTLYDVVIVGLIQPPPEIIEPARIGLRIMLPWTWSIAYRRFNQGALIRFGHSDVIGLGTLIRLIADVIVFLTVAGVILWGGVALQEFVGVYVAWIAFSVGIFAQTLYLWYRSRPARQILKLRDAVGE